MPNLCEPAHPLRGRAARQPLTGPAEYSLLPHGRPIFIPSTPAFVRRKKRVRHPEAVWRCRLTGTGFCQNYCIVLLEASVLLAEQVTSHRHSQPGNLW